MKTCPKCKSDRDFNDQYHQNAFPEAYAMCKWCGYWKKEGEDPIWCNMFFCGCPGSIKDRLGYDWNSSSQCSCQSCGKLLTENDQIKWPVDDPNHPFRKL